MNGLERHGGGGLRRAAELERRQARKSSAACLRTRLAALASLLITGLAAQNAAGAADASGATPPRNALLAAEIGFLELAAGGALTPAERQQAAGAVDADMQGNPKIYLQNFALASKLLARTNKDSASIVIVDWNKEPDRFEQEVFTQSVRQKLRYAFDTATPSPGLEQGDAIETSIVRRHDPTVVLDRARHHIISEVNLSLLGDASAWYARKLGLPGPSADFKDHLRAWFEKNYLGSSADVAGALSDEPQNFLFLTDALKNPPHDDSALQALRTELAGSSPSTRDVLLAIAVSAASLKANENVQEALNEVNQAAGQSMRSIDYGRMVEQAQAALSP